MATAPVASTAKSPELSSKWRLTDKSSPPKSGLSKHLIASFYEVKRSKDGKSWDPVPGGPIVKAPLTEASMEIVLSWNSPFEGAVADKGMPTISAMLQSGAIQPYLDLLGVNGGTASTVQSFVGRTGITKLNSTQVFSGMPPVKIQASALFRAWSDPLTEVEAPFNQLMLWALPEELAPDGAILSMVKAVKDDTSKLQALLPSKSPTCIAMTYKGRTYSPLVLESISFPMNSPVDKNGNFVELLIPMTLCTLTAIDRADWTGSRKI